MKQCKRCKNLLPLDHFGLAPANHDGRNTVCKDCRCIEERNRRATRRKPQTQEPEPMQLPGETWRDIPGLTGCYQVSDLGRVRSLDRYVEKRGGRAQVFPGTILRPQRAGGKKRPYLHVSLQTQGERIGVFVHQLVAWAFLGEPAQGEHVHHINKITDDNRVCNLVYVQAAAHLSAHNRGEMNASAVLCEWDVIQIHSLLIQGRKVPEIARMYGVAAATVYQIRSGHSWKHVAPCCDHLEGNQ